MRLIATSLALLVLIAPTALAQEPDTTDAWRYLPFHLGDIWEYERGEDINCTPQWPPICQHVHVGYLRREVVGDSILGSTSYWKVEETRFDLDGVPSSSPTRLVRFDTTEARAYQFHAEEEQSWPDGFVCPLDLPFGSQEACDYEDNVEVSGTEGELLGMTLRTKGFVLAPGYDAFGFSPDIGLVWVSYGKFTQRTQWIVYARVDGVEYGTRFPVASEAVPEARAGFGLAVHPNPLRHAGTLTLHLDRSERVRIEVFDVLGRRVALVHDSVLPSGEHRLTLDASGLVPGLYVVRAAGGTATTTTRVTVAR